MKTFFGVIGAFLLLTLFFVVYSVVSSLKPNTLKLSDFDTQPISIGQAGGFHLLSDIKVISREQYDSVAIYTKLNRSSAVEEIVTPLTEVTPDGTVGIRIRLADTALLTDLPKTDYDRVTHQTVSNSVIQDVAIANPKSLDTQEVIVSLTKTSRYRLTADPQDAGIIYLDVLK